MNTKLYNYLIKKTKYPPNFTTLFSTVLPTATHHGNVGMQSDVFMVAKQAQHFVVAGPLHSATDFHLLQTQGYAWSLLCVVGVRFILEPHLNEEKPGRKILNVLDCVVLVLLHEGQTELTQLSSKVQ